MRHEITGEGWVGKIKGLTGPDGEKIESTNYYMWLVVDGKKQRKATGTDDLDEANEKLAEWKADLKHGVEQNTKLRYDDMRDAYVAAGKEPDNKAILRDLDKFFGGMRLSSIDVKAVREFKEFRESQKQVIEYEQEQIQKEYALRLHKATVDTGKEPSKKEKDRLHAEATRWATNGTKATTNKRLTILRAMFYHYAEKEQAIKLSDLPATFSLYASSGRESVDNVKQGFVDVEQFYKIRDKLPTDLHNLVNFIYVTGMRTNAARSITWEMLDDSCAQLTVPGHNMKNGQPQPLAMLDDQGQPIFDFISKDERAGKTGLIFNVTEARLRNEWRKACSELNHGVFDKHTRSYRGLSIHDFRRSAIRNLRNSGVAEETAMSISGHKTASIFKRYSIVNLKDQSSAMSKVKLLKTA
jgi:integrase